MVLEPPYDYESDGLTPAVEPEDTYRQESVSGARSQSVQQVFIDYEKTVVPQMMDEGWTEEVAKSRSAPYHNDTDQTLVSHILPGVEVLADIQKHDTDVGPEDFRELVALWTVHDLHKVLNPDGGEFAIATDNVSKWVSTLNLDSFAQSLDTEDFKAVAVALHQSQNANHGDETARFTELRPYLSLTDAVMSIDDPSDFTQAAGDVRTAFRQGPPFVPHSHSIEFDDAITRTLVNESVRDSLADRGLAPIDVRDNGSLYVAPATVDINEDVDQMLDEITDNFLDNLQDSYQIFRNISFLGSNISSPQARFQYESPRVYAITDLAKLCLSNTGLIQRIVQAAIDQQRHPWDISEESRKQIEAVEQATGHSLQRSQRLEGLAALVHTVYREVLPELVTGDSSNLAHERTRIGGLMHLFGVSSETQTEIAELLESGDIEASPVSWPYKYLVAQDLLQRYQGMPIEERKNTLTELLLSRFEDFDTWDNFGLNADSDIHKEIRVLLAARIEIDGTPLHNLGDASDANDIIMERMSRETNKCALCDEVTVEPGVGPNLISHRDFDVLESEFVTKEHGQTQKVVPDNRMPQKSLCVICQLSLTIRAQQFERHFEDDDSPSLHITVHPVTSFSSASLVRFQKVVNKLKDDVFSGDYGGLSLDNLGDWYGDEIAAELERQAGVEALTDRSRVSSIGARFDASASQLALPDDSAESVAQGALIATAASLISGVRVVLTKHPQLYMDSTEQQDLVTYGPELDILNVLFEGRTDVMTLPERLKLVDNMVALGDTTQQPLHVVRQFEQLGERDVLAGSRLFNRLTRHIDSEEQLRPAIEHAKSIDSILASRDTFSNGLVTATESLGRNLAELLPNADPTLADAVMKMVVDVLETTKSVNDTSQLRSTILKRLANRQALDIDPVELLDGGDAHEFAVNTVRVFENVANSDQETLNAMRRPIVDGTTLQATRHALDDGDN